MNFSELPKLERGLQFKLSSVENLISCPIIIAVREVEDWFLAECNHYVCIDPSLSHTFLVSKVHFDPCLDDLTLRTGSAADDLNKIYQFARKTYNKKRGKVEKTVECLDYANLYLIIKNKIPQLKKLVDLIDNFLT